MRHGETLFNKRRKIQGASDSLLTQDGIKQAQEASLYFKENGITFDRAYSSTQERASDTLEIITDMNYKRLKGIKEWNFGVFEGESEDLNPSIDPVLKSYGPFFKNYGGESDLEVQERMHNTLVEIMEQDMHSSVLMVSHGGAMHMLRRKHAPESLESISNCEIHIYDYEDEKFTLIERIKHKFDF